MSIRELYWGVRHLGKRKNYPCGLEKRNVYLCVRVSACVRHNRDSNCIDQLIEEKLTLLFSNWILLYQRNYLFQNLFTWDQVSNYNHNNLVSYPHILTFYSCIIPCYQFISIRDLTCMCTQMLLEKHFTTQHVTIYACVLFIYIEDEEINYDSNEMCSSLV